MKVRPLVSARKSDDVLSMLAEGGELNDPSAKEIIEAQVKEEVAKNKKPWRRYCGHRTIFGDHPDEDGFFMRLFAAQKEHDTRCVLKERAAKDAKRMAQVTVRRQEMLKRNKELRKRNLAREANIKAGDSKFRKSPSKLFSEELANDNQANEAADTGRNQAPCSPTFSADIFGNFVRDHSRPSSVASRHTSDQFKSLRRGTNETSTPDFFGLAFELEGTEYDMDEVPESVACTQTLDSMNMERYQSATLRSLRQKHASTAAGTFSVASSQGIKPTSVGGRLRTYKVPHSARQQPNLPLVQRWRISQQLQQKDATEPLGGGRNAAGGSKMPRPPPRQK